MRTLALLLLCGMVGCSAPHHESSVLENAAEQLSVTSDLADEEAELIHDLRENGGCANYSYVLDRHLSALQSIADRNEKARKGRK